MKNYSEIIRKWISEQVTWAAVAAIGGALVVIWSFLRYFLMFLSSLFKYLQTNVPIYLLMESKDHSINDVRIIFFTIILMMITLSFLNLEIISDKFFLLLTKIVKIHIFSLFILICLVLIGLQSSNIDGDSLFFLDYNSIKSIRDDWGVVYSIFTICLLECTYIGNKYFILNNEYIRAKKRYFSLHKKEADLSNRYKKLNKRLFSNMKTQSRISLKNKSELKKLKKEVWIHRSLKNDMFVELRNTKCIRDKIRRVRLTVVIIILLSIVIDSNHSQYYLIDQNNRIIVADLGSQYVVQEAIIDDLDSIIAVDTSDFMIVNSLNENVRVSNYKLNKLEVLNIAIERENEITIDTLASLIGREEGDIPYNIGKCLWYASIYYETTDDIYLYGNEGKIIFEINGGVVTRAFWVSYTLHERTPNQYKELYRLIQIINETIRLKEERLPEDEVIWTDDSKGIEYYMEFHEVPLVIGVRDLNRLVPYSVIRRHKRLTR